MNDLVDTTEMYLRTIYDLEEEGVVPLRARIAERLDQSGPTVSQTVSRMERDGLLRVAGLVDDEREGRVIRVRANYDQMNGLIAYLTENCCAGAADCGPGATCKPRKIGARK